MNNIHVERTAGAETVTIESFVLLEADGGGVSDNMVARVATEAEAISWKSESAGYRSYRKTVEKFTVFRTIADMKQGEERAKVRELLNMMKGYELDLLRKHIDLLTGE